MRKCPYCDEQIEQDAFFCPHCGRETAVDITTQSPPLPLLSSTKPKIPAPISESTPDNKKVLLIVGLVAIPVILCVLCSLCFVAFNFLAIIGSTTGGPGF